MLSEEELLQSFFITDKGTDNTPDNTMMLKVFSDSGVDLLPNESDSYSNSNTNDSKF